MSDYKALAEAANKMNKQREARYLKAQKYILVFWAILLLAAAGKAFACTAYYTGEYTSGMNRICFYNHLGSSIPYAVPVIKTCPLTVEVPHG